VYETGQVKLDGVGNASPLRRGIAPGAGSPCATPTGIPNRRGDASRLEAMRRPHIVIHPTGEAFREPGCEQEARSVPETGLVKPGGIGNAWPLQRGMANGDE
jgi:hypothetical protein